MSFFHGVSVSFTSKSMSVLGPFRHSEHHGFVHAVSPCHQTPMRRSSVLSRSPNGSRCKPAHRPAGQAVKPSSAGHSYSLPPLSRANSVEPSPSTKASLQGASSLPPTPTPTQPNSQYTIFNQFQKALTAAGFSNQVHDTSQSGDRMARMARQLQEALNRPLGGAGGVSYSIKRPVSFSATSCTSTQLELDFFSELSARPSAIKQLVHMIHQEEHALRSQHLTGCQSVRSAPITESYHVVYAIRNDEMQVHVVPARVVGAEVASLKGRLASEKARRVSLDDRPTTSHLPDAVSDVSRQVSKGWETIASSWATIVPQTQSSPAATNSPAPSWGAWSLPSLSTWTAAPSASVASQAPEPCYQPHYKGNSGVPDWVPLTTGSPSKGAPPSTRGASDTITPPSSTGTSSWWRWPFR